MSAIMISGAGASGKPHKNIYDVVANETEGRVSGGERAYFSGGAQ